MSRSIRVGIGIAAVALVIAVFSRSARHPAPEPIEANPVPRTSSEYPVSADEVFLAPGELPYASFASGSSAASTPGLSPAPVAGAAPGVAPAAGTAAPASHSFTHPAPLVIVNGREVASGTPIGFARIGSSTLPVYHSSLKFFRRTAAIDPSTPTGTRGRQGIEQIELKVTSPGLQTEQARVNQLAALKAQGYAPALLLPSGERVIPTGDLNVVPDPGVSSEDFLAAIRKVGLTVVRSATGSDPWWLIGTGAQWPEDVLKAANRMAEAVPCRFAEPNWIREVRKRSIPTDPYFKNQWHLKNSGQTAGTVGADIAAEGAWDVTKGDPTVIVAVFDDAFDIGHTDLPPASSLIHSRDFVRNTTSPTPADVDENEPDNHGTSVWGLIAAPHNNGRGVAGVAPNVRYMLLRSPMELDERGTADGIRWAANKGAHIMSNSWGYSDPGSVVTSALSYARISGRGGRGTLVFFASGNENADIGTTNDLSNNTNVNAIGATTHQDRRTTYSNYGERLFATAPAGYGENVGLVTTDRRGTAGYTSTSYTLAVGSQFDGTSGACPIAAGVAALVFSVNPNFTAAEVKTILRETADKVQPGTGAYDASGHSSKYGYGRLNARAAVARAKIVKAGGGDTSPKPVDTSVPVTGNVVFREDFENLALGATSSANRWTLVPTQASGSVFQVATVSGNKYLKAYNLQGAAVWKSAAISIAGRKNLSIRLKFAEIGTLEAADTIEAWYKIDGRAPVRWFTYADDAGSAFTEKSVTGLSGTSLVIWIASSNGASEEWRVDDIEVSGLPVVGAATARSVASGASRVVFQENFEDLAAGATGVENAWTTSGAAGEARLEVAAARSRKFLAGTSLEGGGTWRLTPQNIAGLSNVEVRMRISEIGVMDKDDYLKASYRIDGGPLVEWFTQTGEIVTGARGIEKEISGLSGGKIEVLVEFRSNARSEAWRIDNFAITGSD